MGTLCVQKVKNMIFPTVYTSLEGLSLKKANVVSIRELDPYSIEWITETAISRLEKRTEAQLTAKAELEGLFPEVEEQVYFKIEGKSFFVDFYIPDHDIAILVDNGDYGGRVSRRRDETFKGIGIRTVRIKAERVLEGCLRDDLLAELRYRVQKERGA